MLRERPRIFVGRKAELDLLTAYIQRGTSVVGVVGVGGMGKTAFVNEFVAQQADLFPGGVAFAPADAFDDPRDYLSHALPDVENEQSLIVIDYAEMLHPALRSQVLALTKSHPKLRLILISRTPILDQHQEYGPQQIALAGLNDDEIGILLSQYGVDPAAGVVGNLTSIWGGAPIFSMMLAELVEGGLPADAVLSGLDDFHRPGLLGPDGHPLDAGSINARRLIVDITEVNDELLALIKTDPEALRAVTSRKFEEIIAEILVRLGYQVTLTPPSRDGGFDIAAARKDSVGSFLYLVECKRYTPPNKVGVEIVRALHGVVQAHRATAGLVVTSSFFTRGAKEFRESTAYQMQLKDYVELQTWLRQV